MQHKWFVTDPATVIYDSPSLSLYLFCTPQGLRSSLHLLHPPPPPPPLLQPRPSCPVGRDDALTARRLFSEVLVFQWHRGGGWSRNSAGVVVFSVGVGDLGRAGLVGDR